MRRLIYKPECKKRIGSSYPTIWKWMRSGIFPRSVVVGGRVAWYEDEIEKWLNSLPRQNLLGDEKPSLNAKNLKNVQT
jgi:predicted DNA-binding transcriptional regulator AlpA